MGVDLPAPFSPTMPPIVRLGWNDEVYRLVGLHRHAPAGLRL